ncbi:Uncharacterised protein [Vibrio cholerae]|nr:Uncharacterised protein [Vibrio cholerae]
MTQTSHDPYLHPTLIAMRRPTRPITPAPLYQFLNASFWFQIFSAISNTVTPRQ